MFKKCTGYRLSKGSFTDERTGQVLDYDNVLLYLESDLATIDGVGIYTQEVKIKRSVFGDVSRCSQLIGKEVEVETDFVRGKAVPIGVRTREQK